MLLHDFTNDNLENAAIYVDSYDVEAEFYEKERKIKMPITKKDISMTKNMLRDFGICVKDFELPDSVKTKGDLLRWRRKVIEKHVDRYQSQKQIAPRPKKLNRNKEIMSKARPNIVLPVK